MTFRNGNFNYLIINYSLLIVFFSIFNLIKGYKHYIKNFGVLNEFSVLTEGISANVDPGLCEDP